ncbi:MAG: right-handed parallel beta-helix repeat-containing protein [Planctomycetota bacterium]|nr:right-handed parallel beta-helix repeat-containing protein [Planctomycetota bacterium]
MRQSLILSVLVGIVIAASRCMAADAVTYYVAPNGNDTWSGKLPQPNGNATDGPTASLQRARDLVRAARQGGLTSPVNVVVAGGDYYVDHSLQLTAEDSGKPESPVTYRAQAGQPVRLIGGRRIAGFKAITDPAILARLAPAARRQVLQADLKSQGIADFGQLTSRGFGRPIRPAALELFFRDQPMTLARWPNDAFVKIASIPQDQTEGDGHGGKLGKLPAGFHYDGDRPSTWRSLNDIHVHGYWAWDWANSYERIASIDLQTRLIKTAPPHGLYGFRAGQRIYFLNILEELDSPGEWYLDRDTGLLYFWPPAPIEQARVLVSLVHEPMISLKGVSYVTIRGLTIECSRGTGIEISNGANNTVADCTLRNLGNYAVIVRGGSAHTVSSCEISHTGDGGIDLSGGDRKAITPAGHLAFNNHIHHVGRWSKCYVPAIHINGVGIRAANNLIHDHPHCAILFGGNEHVIELNEIHHVCLETGDVGAIYAGRDYSYRGNVIKHNYIHDTGGVGMGSMGVYMDDCVSGTLIEGNVFHKVQRAVFLGGGRDFRVENNVFVDCNPAVQLDGRGMDKSPVWHNMVYDYMKKRLEDVNWKQPPYRSRYPEMATLEKYYEGDPGIPPENILVARNVCVGKWLDIGWHAKKEAVELKDNLVGADPGFVDPGAGIFQLKEDSPAYGQGFQRIPFERIGLLKTTQ